MSNWWTGFWNTNGRAMLRICVALRLRSLGDLAVGTKLVRYLPRGFFSQQSTSSLPAQTTSRRWCVKSTHFVAGGD
jgi:hypothetical protein